jgi:outer membrane protein OmpA-like peptidoglycan-associated protein
MLHAPTNDNETKAATGKKEQPTLSPERELYPFSVNVAGQQPIRGAGGWPLLRSAAVQSCRHFGTLQRAYGNQAVLRMLHAPAGTATTSARGAVLQRRCACGGPTSLTGECNECRAKDTTLQRHSLSSMERGQSEGAVPPIVHDVLRSPGQQLDPDTRAFMEPRFSHDFSQVRVHMDAKAIESAKAVNALAYTLGRNIVFGVGQYAPRTESGLRLLAHELTHTIQQSSDGISSMGIRISDPGDTEEREADAYAARITPIHKTVAFQVERRSHTSMLQRRVGDLTQRPPGLPCPPATNLPTSRITELSFSIGGATLSAAHKAQVEAFVGSWRALGGSTPVRVDGFASTDGSELLNWRLSCDRAQKVVAELLSPSSGRVPGIPSGSITFFAQGETDEFSKSDLAPNRRATISSPAPVPPTPTPPTPVGPPGCVAPTNPDMSGRAFNPTTDSENAVIAKHPIDAFSVDGARSDAFRAAGSSGLAGPHLGPQDAFRHCVWNCLMAQRIGVTRAEQFATAHENSGPSSIPFDNQMDLHDNAIGRSLGTPGANCEASSMSAVTSGQLRTIRGPHTLPPAVPPVPADCIGASNQPWP